MTSQIDAQTTARATEAEPVAYLTKPVGSRDLIEAVKKGMASRWSGPDTDEPDQTANPLPVRTSRVAANNQAAFCQPNVPALEHVAPDDSPVLALRRTG